MIIIKQLQVTAGSGFTKSVVGFGVDWKLQLVFNALTALKDWLQTGETLSQKLCPIKLNGDTLECVDKFCYLGDMIGSFGGAEDASSME